MGIQPSGRTHGLSCGCFVMSDKMPSTTLTMRSISESGIETECLRMLCIRVSGLCAATQLVVGRGGRGTGAAWGWG